MPVYSANASAQDYPARPITMVVPYAAGGPTDVASRIVAERLETSLGQPVIIENIGGADGSEHGLPSTHVLNGAFYLLTYDVLND